MAYGIKEEDFDSSIGAGVGDACYFNRISKDGLRCNSYYTGLRQGGGRRLESQQRKVEKDLGDLLMYRANTAGLLDFHLYNTLSDTKEEELALADVE